MKKRIVVCDDNSYELKGLEKLINRNFSNCEVVLFDDANRALDFLKENVADLLVTDIKMPLLTGLDLALMSKKIQQNIETVILSAYPEFEYAQRAIRIGVQGYLTKPVDERQFAELLRSILGESKEEKGEISELSKKILQEYIGGRARLSENSLLCIRHIEEHYSDPELDLEQIAKSLFLSVSYLCSVFKADCGISIGKFINAFRMNLARDMLEQTMLPVKTIMGNVGYENFPYFSNSFHKMFGLYPSGLREKKA